MTTQHLNHVYNHLLFPVINLALFLLLTISTLIVPPPTHASEPLTCKKSRTQKIKQRYVIMDCESDKQLDELSWKCGTTYERVKEHATSGHYSLKIEMYPKFSWPGFGKSIKKSWVGYNYLSIDIFNPSSETINLSYRIDDRLDDPPYTDRANGRLQIIPGPNPITFNLKELKTSDGKRYLNLKKICSFMLFLHQPPKKVTLFLDDLTVSKK